ncbi:hypothetical protein SEA_KALAH2_188 [Mycobacterium phage Kalah2]|nr:hypothetical protein SEA_KALAH2_188 [Mycobacterium phage Kalah2]
MNTIAMLWHDLVLRHGDAWVELNFSKASRRFGTVIECPCGKRWLSRMPWFRR